MQNQEFVTTHAEIVEINTQDEHLTPNEAGLNALFQFHGNGIDKYNHVDIFTKYRYPHKIEILEFEFIDNPDLNNQDMCIFMEVFRDRIIQLRFPLRANRNYPITGLERNMNPEVRGEFIDLENIYMDNYELADNVWLKINIALLGYTRENTVDDLFFRGNAGNWKAKFRLHFCSNPTPCKSDNFSSDSESSEDEQICRYSCPNNQKIDEILKTMFMLTDMNIEIFRQLNLQDEVIKNIAKDIKSLSYIMERNNNKQTSAGIVERLKCIWSEYSKKKLYFSN